MRPGGSPLQLPTQAVRLICLLAAVASSVLIAHADDDISAADVWRQPDPENLLLLELPMGTVIIELAPGFAPEHVANIRTMVREEYFNGLPIVRSQDNYVAQWGDPAESDDDLRSIGSAAESLQPEFERDADGVDLVAIKSRDAYADVVGFVDGFPVGSNGKTLWMAHCYGVVGVARSTAPDSGNGSSLYVTIGHAPRHLDRNLSMVGRVISGIENLSSLPRGTGPLGFYESPEETTPILRARVGSDIPQSERAQIDIMRTDSDDFSDYVEDRTHRREAFFVNPTGRIEICNLTPPVKLTL